jgi:Ca-activated chloride channel family protein
MLLVALLRGAAARTPSRQQQVPVFRSTATLVNLSFLVRDADGGLVNDLGKDDFLVLEDGQPQEIRWFSRESQLPLSLAIELDCSGFGPSALGERGLNLLDFLRTALRAGDKAAMVTYVGPPGIGAVVADWTSDWDYLAHRFDVHRQRAPCGKASLEKTIRDGIAMLQSGSRQELALDRIGDSLELVTKQVQRLGMGRRAVLVTNDDQEDGSTLRNEQVAALQALDAIAYVVLVPKLVTGSTDAAAGSAPPARPRDMRGLEKWAAETGGSVLRTADIGWAFDQIAQELRSQYTIAYSPTNSKADGRYRAIEIKTLRPGLVVRARKGYVAPRD